MTKKMSGGLSDLGYEMDAYAPIADLAEDYEFFGLDQFISMEMMQSAGLALASGAGGILAVMNIMDRVEYFADKPKARALAEMAIAIVGGRALWEVNRDAAMGFAGGVGGYSLASLINQYIAEMQANSAGNGTDNGTTTEGLAYTEVQRTPSYRKLDRVSVPAGWGGGRAPANMAADLVTRANYSQTDGIGDVSGWLS